MNPSLVSLCDTLAKEIESLDEADLLPGELQAIILKHLQLLAKDSGRLDHIERNRFDLCESDGAWYLAGFHGVEQSFPTVRAAIDDSLTPKPGI